jgi:hypothetical protein
MVSIAEWAVLTHTRSAGLDPQLLPEFFVTIKTRAKELRTWRAMLKRCWPSNADAGPTLFSGTEIGGAERDQPRAESERLFAFRKDDPHLSSARRHSCWYEQQRYCMHGPDRVYRAT